MLNQIFIVNREVYLYRARACRQCTCSQ